jgi:NitT/TauT family transport system substrate-binding protein
MQTSQNRRRFLATLSSATAAGLVDAPKVFAAEPPLETTRIRLFDWAGICIAPQFVAEDLLKSEGFTDVQYVRIGTGAGEEASVALASGTVDINSQFCAPSIVRVEAGDPVVFLGVCTSAASSCSGQSKFAPFAISRERRSRSQRWARHTISSSPA